MLSPKVSFLKSGKGGKNKFILVHYEGKIHHHDGEEIMVFPDRGMYKDFVEDMKENLKQGESISKEVVKNEDIIEKLKELF